MSVNVKICKGHKFNIKKYIQHVLIQYIFLIIFQSILRVYSS